MNKETLIIIPAYNEEATIDRLLNSLSREGIMRYCDVLVVNDYSTDRTISIARSHAVAVVGNIFNLGYGSALQLGYKYAARNQYRYVIQMDADGQHDISNVDNLLAALKTPMADGERPDIVIGSRFESGSVTFAMSGLKLAAQKLFSTMIKVFTGVKIKDTTSGLQGLSRRAFCHYALYTNFNCRYPDANMIVQMIMKGYKVIEIPSVMHSREAGESMHSGIIKPILYMFIMTISILTVALRERQKGFRKTGVAL